MSVHFPFVNLAAQDVVEDESSTSRCLKLQNDKQWMMVADCTLSVNVINFAAQDVMGDELKLTVSSVLNIDESRDSCNVCWYRRGHAGCI